MVKILVCVIGQLRFTSVTWGNFKRYVLDELEADMVTCGRDSEVDNEFTRHSLLNIHSDPKENTTPQIILEHRRNLFATAPKTYDQYIITRSDHVWTGPHPKLDTDHAWFMNCQAHGGISDRHWVLNRNDFEKYLSDPGICPLHRSIEQHLGFKVEWGPKTALCYFPMYLSDENGNYKRPDEIEHTTERFYWPFTFKFTKGPYGTLPGTPIHVKN